MELQLALPLLLPSQLRRLQISLATPHAPLPSHLARSLAPRAVFQPRLELTTHQPTSTYKPQTVEDPLLVWMSEPTLTISVHLHSPVTLSTPLLTQVLQRLCM